MLLQMVWIMPVCDAGMALWDLACMPAASTVGPLHWPQASAQGLPTSCRLQTDTGIIVVSAPSDSSRSQLTCQGRLVRTSQAVWGALLSCRVVHCNVLCRTWHTPCVPDWLRCPGLMHPNDQPTAFKWTTMLARSPTAPCCSWTRTRTLSLLNMLRC